MPGGLRPAAFPVLKRPCPLFLAAHLEPRGGRDPTGRGVGASTVVWERGFCVPTRNDTDFYNRVTQPFFPCVVRPVSLHQHRGVGQGVRDLRPVK